jgi:hypothetical protein
VCGVPHQGELAGCPDGQCPEVEERPDFDGGRVGFGEEGLEPGIEVVVYA